MARDELEVEREALVRYSGGFGDGARGLSRIHDRLSEALSAEGQCWGDDQVGRAFAQKYQQPRQAADRTFGELTTSLDQTEEGLRTMAANYQRAEQASGG